MLKSEFEIQTKSYGKRSYHQRFLILIFLTPFLCYYLTSNFKFQRLEAIPAVEDVSTGLKLKESTSAAQSAKSYGEELCHLPNLKPFNKAIAKYVHKQKPIDCSKNPKSPYDLLFRIDRDGILHGTSTDSLAGRSCCYLPFKQKTEPRYIDNCIRITGNVTIPPETEFIAIYCLDGKSTSGEKRNASILVDLLHFTPLKAQVENRLTLQKVTLMSYQIEETPQYNVVIFGIDAVSHLNFQRTMPLTRAYLLDVLSAEFLNGYTKVGDNTFPNIVPVLTGLDVKELEKLCWPTRESYFDSCPFIWKNFSDTGYRTSYSEDAVWMGTFEYMKNGFKNAPTDYYLNDFMRTAANTIGHLKDLNAKLCYGPRLAFSILLDNMEKLAFQMGMDRRYFQFTWATSISHDFLNYPGIADGDLLSSLKFLNDGGHLNKTILLLMSDHGIRTGGIRKTFQGKIEENMPFLYTVFPQEFRDAYPQAIKNFIQNQQKLTTPFDLHEMLKDLINLESITDGQINRRQESLILSSYPRGISLFLQIPANRSCEDAAIQDPYCVCHSMSRIPVDSPGVLSVAKAAVWSINQILNPFKQCAKLTFSSAMSAHRVQMQAKKTDLMKMEQIEYTVLFRTKPGDALFEATMITSKNKTLEDSKSWKLAGDISRINSYGNQSHCVTDYNIKKYCYC